MLQTGNALIICNQISVRCYDFDAWLEEPKEDVRRVSSAQDAPAVNVGVEGNVKTVTVRDVSLY